MGKSALCPIRMRSQRVRGRLILSSSTLRRQSLVDLVTSGPVASASVHEIADSSSVLLGDARHIRYLATAHGSSPTIVSSPVDESVGRAADRARRRAGSPPYARAGRQGQRG